MTWRQNVCVFVCGETKLDTVRRDEVSMTYGEGTCLFLCLTPPRLSSSLRKERDLPSSCTIVFSEKRDVSFFFFFFSQFFFFGCLITFFALSRTLSFFFFFLSRIAKLVFGIALPLEYPENQAQALAQEILSLLQAYPDPVVSGSSSVASRSSKNRSKVSARPINPQVPGIRSVKSIRCGDRYIYPVVNHFYDKFYKYLYIRSMWSHLIGEFFFVCLFVFVILKILSLFLRTFLFLSVVMEKRLPSLSSD